MAAQLPTSRIDRTSPVPFYFQLKKTLAEEIVAGRWLPGDRLPSEPSVCAHFDVSRTTVRQALGELEAEGMIRREKGRGTFVAAPRSTSWLLQSARGFYEEAVGAGHAVRSRVLRRGLETLPSWACDALDLAEAVLAANLEVGSLYRTLEQATGVRVFGGRRVVEAVTGQDPPAGVAERQRGRAADPAGRPGDDRGLHRGASRRVVGSSPALVARVWSTAWTSILVRSARCQAR